MGFYGKLWETMDLGWAKFLEADPAPPSQVMMLESISCYATRAREMSPAGDEQSAGAA